MSPGNLAAGLWQVAFPGRLLSPEEIDRLHLAATLLTDIDWAAWCRSMSWWRDPLVLYLVEDDWEAWKGCVEAIRSGSWDELMNEPEKKE